MDVEREERERCAESSLYVWKHLTRRHPDFHRGFGQGGEVVGTPATMACHSARIIQKGHHKSVKQAFADVQVRFIDDSE